jgi:hypothetical protein
VNGDFGTSLFCGQLAGKPLLAFTSICGAESKPQVPVETLFAFEGDWGRFISLKHEWLSIWPLLGPFLQAAEISRPI